MKKIRHRLIRIISYVVLIIFTLGMVTRIVNGIRFITAKPEEAQECNYSGTWKSERALMVAGRILATIPYPPPMGETFTVKAYVYYNINSLYRPGRFIPMEMEGFIQDSGASAGGNSEKPIVLPPRITFKFKGNPGPSGKQTIDYVSTSDSAFTQITGGYRSQSPYDIGCFYIEKTR